jgi:SAM-dependent methyltransferase
MILSDFKLSKKNFHRNCPICENLSGNILRNFKFSLPLGTALSDSYDLVECDRCGFIFADTISSQEQYNHYYNSMSKYEDKKLSSGTGSNSFDQYRLQETARSISKIVKDHEALILDIGCGNGGLLSCLKELGYQNLTGMDPSPQCAKNIQDLGFKGISGDIFSSNEIIQYDCIILSHVFEHLVNVKTAFKKILTLLKTGGVIYLEVPDASRYKEFYIVPFYYFDIEHINHFDKNSLINLINQEHLCCLDVNSKNLRLTDSLQYPAIYVLIKNEKVLSEKEILKTSEVKDSVLTCLSKSQKSDNISKLETLVKTGNNVIVWGAGSYTQRLLTDSSLGKCNIVAFVDNDQKKHGLKMNDIYVYSSEILKNENFSKNSVIVIACALHGNDIRDQIIKMNITNDIIIL